MLSKCFHGSQASLTCTYRTLAISMPACLRRDSALHPCMEGLFDSYGMKIMLSFRAKLAIQILNSFCNNTI